MASLSAHLRQAGDHGDLAFHPECPVCRRDRLSGVPPHDAFVGRRTKALLAAGVVAVWSASPTTVLATEPDQEQTETPAPDQAVADGSLSDPAFDPGGPSDPPVVDVPVPEPQAPADAADDAGPVEQEPTTDEVVPIVDPGDRAEKPEQPEQQEPPGADQVSTPASTPPATPPPPPPQEAAPAPPEVVSSAPAADMQPVTEPPEEKESAIAPARAHERDSKPDRAAPSQAIAPPVVPAVPVPRPEPIAPVTHVSTPPVGATVKADRATASTTRNEGRARVHVVQRNESLWSIANELLGNDASPARIAREVNRLWELNSSRIGTGDRDLLLTGTKLVLR
jgi:hypothetical protein